MWANIKEFFRYMSPANLLLVFLMQWGLRMCHYPSALAWVLSTVAFASYLYMKQLDEEDEIEAMKESARKKRRKRNDEEDP